MSEPIIRELRGSVASGDGVQLVLFLSHRPWPEHRLQLIGDGLLRALRDRVDGVPEVAAECASALRKRGWRGDEVLADALESRLGAAPARLLKPLAVNLEELASILEGDPVYGGGRVDLRTGEVWPQGNLDYFEETDDDEDEDDPERWLWVHCEGSRDGYRDMEWFISDIGDPAVANALERAITGRGAFRRFKDTLSRWPELLELWFAFSEDRQSGRARAWLADEGYAAVPRSIAVT